MTDDRIALRELLEKGSDATLLREMFGFTGQRLMELETNGLCDAAHGERSADRLLQSNGYRECDLADPGRHGRATDSEAPAGLLLLGLP